MIDQHGEDSRIFETSHAMDVIINYETSGSIKNPVFVFCIYLPDGRCASQWIWGPENYGQRKFNGKGRVVFQINRLILGRAAYVASAGIFKSFRTDGLESESYHVRDRFLHFQITQPVGDNTEHGLCHQPYDARIEENER